MIPFLDGLRAGLKGWPEGAISLGLVLAGAFLILVGLFWHDPLGKAAVLAWVVAP